MIIHELPSGAHQSAPATVTVFGSGGSCTAAGKRQVGNTGTVGAGYYAHIKASNIIITFTLSLSLTNSSSSSSIAVLRVALLKLNSTNHPPK